MKLEIERWFDSIPERQRKYIQSRWNEWLPAIELHLKSSGEFKDQSYYPRFLFRIKRLLEAQLPWVTIRKHRLDNPLLSAGEFDRELELRVTRRKSGIARSRTLQHNQRMRNNEIHS